MNPSKKRAIYRKFGPEKCGKVFNNYVFLGKLSFHLRKNITFGKVVGKVVPFLLWRVLVR